VTGLAARCRALLSDGREAEQHYSEALGDLEEAGARVDYLHTMLLYGEWLRRANRTQDARSSLRGAFEGFTEIGAAGFAERARLELAATGENVRTVPSSRDAVLTEQETQVAELAMQVATKAEIAERLYLSVHTVDYHLRSVYRKLGVRSRSEFARAYRQQRLNVD
jgi:DNA-binding CsgD family transcriptional regulator